MNETVKSSKLLSGALQLGLAAAITFTVDQLGKLYKAVKDYMSASNEMSDNLTKSSNLAKYQMLYQTLVDIQKRGVFTGGDIDEIQEARAEINKLTAALNMDRAVTTEQELKNLIVEVEGLKDKETQKYLDNEKTKQAEAEKSNEIEKNLNNQLFEQYAKVS